jgi:hypothetical protein
MKKYETWTGSYFLEAIDAEGNTISNEIVVCYRRELKNKLVDLKERTKANTAQAYYTSGKSAVESI